MKEIFNDIRNKASLCSDKACFYPDDTEVISERRLKQIIDEAEIQWNKHKVNGDWIPVTQTLPQPEETVQVTYLSSCDGTPMCNAVAYIDADGEWHWDDMSDSVVMVEITAWKHMGKPYRPKEASDNEQAASKESV